MVIKNKELNKILRENGRDYVIMLYINRFIHLTNKQLEYILEYGKKEDK